MKSLPGRRWHCNRWLLELLLRAGLLATTSTVWVDAGHSHCVFCLGPAGPAGPAGTAFCAGLRKHQQCFAALKASQLCLLPGPAPGPGSAQLRRWLCSLGLPGAGWTRSPGTGSAAAAWWLLFLGAGD